MEKEELRETSVEDPTSSAPASRGYFGNQPNGEQAPADMNSLVDVNLDLQVIRAIMALVVPF